MNHAVILAAGQSQRMLRDQDKLLIKVANHPVIYYSIASLNDHNLIDSITLVVNKINNDEMKKIVKGYRFNKVKLIILGGLTRQESLEKAIQAVQQKFKPRKNDLIVVHNGANPLPSYDEILQSVAIAAQEGACIVGHKIESTVKRVKNKIIEETLDRNDLFAAQTPQVIKYDIFIRALKNAAKHSLEVTDESMLVEALGHKVSIIEAHENNFKITTQADIERLKQLLGEGLKHFKVGIGQDSHVFSKTEKGLTLGGLYFKDEPLLEADSDGDVVLHAIFNAISQAIGGESLGFYADSLCQKKGITDSKKYLEVLFKKLKEEKMEIGNLGLMVECKKPKIDPIAKKIKESLSRILNLDPKHVGITATTGENLTSFGLGLGIQCFAIISLFEKGHSSEHSNIIVKSKKTATKSKKTTAKSQSPKPTKLKKSSHAASRSKIQRKSKSKSGRSRGKK